MRSNWAMFRRSLAAHQGIGFGVAWPLLVLLSFLLRADFHQLPLGRVLLLVAVLGAVPWVAIFCTAWQQRRYFKDAR